MVRESLQLDRSMEPERHQPSRSEFIAHVRPDLKEVITPELPISYWSMEYYSSQEEGPKGQGGLGMLASDTIETAIRLGLPMVLVTPFYSVERSYGISPDFEQFETYDSVTPEERGLLKRGEVNIATAVHPEVSISIYTKQAGSVLKVFVTEPNLGQLYEAENYSDKRLYQEVAEGFAGYKALKMLNIRPSMNHYLNEAPTVFAALARLDDRIGQMQTESPERDSQDIFSGAFYETRKNTIYTNHTLVRAVEAEFTLEQFEHFVLPNIKSPELKQWLIDKINDKGGRIQLSSLAIDLAEKKNGVSLIHAREASREYKDDRGDPVRFEGITNGIALDRWVDAKLLKLYREAGVVDKFDLPCTDYKQAIDALDSVELAERKAEAKIRLRDHLKQRLDQYGQAMDIPEGEKIFNWRRRFADYKRPKMLFADPQKLAEILEREQIHLVMSGNVHPADQDMRKELKDMLNIIDQNPVLKARVHFVQDYDEALGRVLVQGADVSINTPTVIRNGVRVSTEACGTSWEKDVANSTILISTEDGGVADARMRAEAEGVVNFEAPYLEITGSNYSEEVESMYAQMERASRLVDNKDSELTWSSFVKKQLKGFLPVISSARMEVDYLNFGIPLAQAA